MELQQREVLQSLGAGKALQSLGKCLGFDLSPEADASWKGLTMGEEAAVGQQQLLSSAGTVPEGIEFNLQNQYR